MSAGIALQMLIIGSLGVVFTASALLGGLLSSLLVPVQQVFAVILLHEHYSAEKGLALAICLWGFTSYLYGQYRGRFKKPEPKNESDSGCEAI